MDDSAPSCTPPHAGQPSSCSTLPDKSATPSVARCRSSLAQKDALPEKTKTAAANADLPVPFTGPTGLLPAASLSRVLMGPGPSVGHPRCLHAQAQSLVGHMSPAFFEIMDEIKIGLRYVFQTQSPYTCLLSGTGHAGMETCLANLLEEGETVVIASNGIWGERAAEMAGRLKLRPIVLTVPTTGASSPSPSPSSSSPEQAAAFSCEALIAAVKEHRPAALFVVAGESSTGAYQTLGEGLVGAACREAGCLLVVDTVASLGGVPFFGDAWGVDACYSGSQKCMSAPPGASPLFLSERAWAKIKGRKTKPFTFNFDISLIARYWQWTPGEPRFYHHTGAVSTYFAVREALAVVGEEGLPRMWARHKIACEQLWRGLGALGLKPYVSRPEERLVTVNTIKVPERVDWARLVGFALREFGLEISGGLGPSAGKAWRVGLMCYGCTRANVALVLEAFRAGLEEQGWKKGGEKEEEGA
jgi:alanine-glyoxylate transaminase / serine-glyoxylate transaminase / serine-pyruvate transaminase